MAYNVIYKNKEKIDELKNKIKEMESEIKSLKEDKICLHCGKDIPKDSKSKYFCSIDCEVQKTIQSKTKEIERRVKMKYENK